MKPLAPVFFKLIEISLRAFLLDEDELDGTGSSGFEPPPERDGTGTGRASRFHDIPLFKFSELLTKPEVKLEDAFPAFNGSSPTVPRKSSSLSLAILSLSFFIFSVSVEPVQSPNEVRVTLVPYLLCTLLV